MSRRIFQLKFCLWWLVHDVKTLCLLLREKIVLKRFAYLIHLRRCLVPYRSVYDSLKMEKSYARPITVCNWQWHNHKRQCTWKAWQGSCVWAPKFRSTFHKLSRKQNVPLFTFATILLDTSITLKGLQTTIHRTAFNVPNISTIFLDMRLDGSTAVMCRTMILVKLKSRE